jgi:hypothetical protein
MGGVRQGTIQNGQLGLGLHGPAIITAAVNCRGTDWQSGGRAHGVGVSHDVGWFPSRFPKNPERWLGEAVAGTPMRFAKTPKACDNHRYQNRLDERDNYSSSQSKQVLDGIPQDGSMVAKSGKNDRFDPCPFYIGNPCADAESYRNKSV